MDRVDTLNDSTIRSQYLSEKFGKARCTKTNASPTVVTKMIAERRKRLNRMLAMGQSRPWPDALEALSGERRMDATAIIDYFAPLKTWLDEQNKKP